MPKTWLIEHNTPKVIQTLSIELSKPTKEITPTNQKTEAKTEPRKTEPVKPVVDDAQNKPTKTPPQPKVVENKPAIQKQLPQKQPIKNSSQQHKSALNASDVQIMMSKAVDLKFDDETFSARNSNSNFISKKYVATNKYADLPYLDESVDAPRLAMDFYSAGAMGSVERFFDKITYEKTFTTKYGTKIKCAVVGVLALCGWK